MIEIKSNINVQNRLWFLRTTRYIIQSIFELSLVKSNLISDFDIPNYIWQGMYNQYNEVLNSNTFIWYEIHTTDKKINK